MFAFYFCVCSAFFDLSSSLLFSWENRMTSGRLWNKNLLEKIMKRIRIVRSETKEREKTKKEIDKKLWKRKRCHWDGWNGVCSFQPKVTYFSKSQMIRKYFCLWWFICWFRVYRAHTNHFARLYLGRSSHTQRRTMPSTTATETVTPFFVTKHLSIYLFTEHFTVFHSFSLQTPAKSILRWRDGCGSLIN